MAQTAVGLLDEIVSLFDQATNLGLVKMVEACGVPYDVLDWTWEWYVAREDCRSGKPHEGDLGVGGLLSGPSCTRTSTPPSIGAPA
ncbi:hypothetical protein [Actinoplanes sp. NBRC 103695]|uniref:hypothetical protein n=1 Tax=Actinoplanes sp. NBRC 103695 TaxID=3032202 RepID=UPI0024A26A26|nr:hypothetical protein [Actinoplanes sp. NBRC 103695]GLY95095.1 hypothetical protein Acsp02_23500 [Actinoplanes sp. NBRC 103695]